MINNLMQYESQNSFFRETVRNRFWYLNVVILFCNKSMLLIMFRYHCTFNIAIGDLQSCIIVIYSTNKIKETSECRRDILSISHYTRRILLKLLLWSSMLPISSDKVMFLVIHLMNYMWYIKCNCNSSG